MHLQGAVEARNRDYANIVRSLNFVSKGWYDIQVQADEDADTRRKVSVRCSLTIQSTVNEQATQAWSLTADDSKLNQPQ